MPIDPSIPLGVRPPQPVNPFGDIMQIMQLKQAQQLLPLKIQEAKQAAQENAIKLRQMQQAESDRQATDAAFKGALTVGDDGVPTWDRQKLLQAVPGHLAPVLGKTLDEADKTRTELLKAQQEVAAKQAEHGAGVAAAIQSSGNDPTFARQQFAIEAATNPSSANSVKQILAQLDQHDQADPTGQQSKAFLDQITKALIAKGGPAFTTAQARQRTAAVSEQKLPGELARQAAEYIVRRLDFVSTPLERGWSGEPTPDGGLAFTRRLRGVQERHVIDGPLMKSAEARKLDVLADELQAIYQRPGTLVAKDKETPISAPTELFAAVLEAGRRGVTIQRYKGLGEMNPDQLWETTLDPEARTLLQVRVNHADEADEIFSTLMGDVVEPRRDFIQDNALKVANLDV